MSGDPIIKARLAKGGGVWQTEEMISQSGRNRWRGFPLRKPVTCMGVRFFIFLYSLFLLAQTDHETDKFQNNVQWWHLEPDNTGRIQRIFSCFSDLFQFSLLMEKRCLSHQYTHQ